MFFTQFNQMMRPGLDYHLTISQTQTGMTVILMPKANGLKDDAQNNIVPLTFKGTPEELDANFLAGIAAPVQQVSGLLTNMAEFEKSANKAAAESKAAKTEKDKADKEAKAKKEKYDSFMKKAEEQETAGNPEGALTNLQQARLHATEKNTKTVDEKIAAIKAVMSQGSLFDVAPVQPQAAPVQQPAVQAVQQQAVPIQQQVAEAPLQQPPVQAAPVQQAQQAMGFGMFQQQAAPPAEQQYTQPPAAQQAPVATHHPEPDVMIYDSPVFNDSDYANIPDVQVTHVGQQMYNPQ